MFGSKQLKNKIEGLEFELSAADEEIVRNERRIESLNETLTRRLHRVNELSDLHSKNRTEIATLKERLTAAMRGNGDLQKALDEAVRRQEDAVKHEQAALADWSRLTVFILDNAPQDIIQNSTGSTVDLAIALLTRWMPVTEDKVVDADVVDEIMGADEKPVVKKRSAPIKVDYMDSEGKKL